MTLAIEPRPLSEVQGKYDEANLPSSWTERGRILAEASLAEWPFIEWDIVARAADCFTIAAALAAALPLNGVDDEGIG